MTKFLKWPGGKKKLIPQYVPYFPTSPLPPNNYYLEPFLGSGAVFFYLYSKGLIQPRQAILADINPQLINAFVVVRDSPEPLLSLLQDYQDDFLPLPKEERDLYYYRQRDRFNELRDSTHSIVELAALLIFLNRTNFNSLMRFSSKGKFNSPVGKYQNPCICNRKVIQQASAALQGADIRCASFRETLEVGEEVKGDWVFCDPPYLKTHLAKRSFVGYTKQGFSMQDQVDLASRAKHLADSGASVWVCNSETLVALTLYHGFKIVPIDAERNINAKVGGRGKVGEILAIARHKSQTD